MPVVIKYFFTRVSSGHKTMPRVSEANEWHTFMTSRPRGEGGMQTPFFPISLYFVTGMLPSGTITYHHLSQLTPEVTSEIRMKGKVRSKNFYSIYFEQKLSQEDSRNKG